MGRPCLGSKYKDTIIRSFRKCGISLPIDGSEDSEINISGIEDFEVGSADTEASDSELDGDVTDIDVEDGDPFTDL